MAYYSQRVQPFLSEYENGRTASSGLRKGKGTNAYKVRVNVNFHRAEVRNRKRSGRNIYRDDPRKFTYLTDEGFPIQVSRVLTLARYVFRMKYANMARIKL